MRMQMSPIPVKRVFLDSNIAVEEGMYEFTIDCGAVYFGAVYDSEGSLISIDQYFYSEECSRDDLKDAAVNHQLLGIDDKDYWIKAYLLTKEQDGREWLRFHAVAPETIDPDYFHQKYVSDN